MQANYNTGPTNLLSGELGEPGLLPQKLAGRREGRRVYIWPATPATADMLEKIIANYQVPWKHLLIPGAVLHGAGGVLGL